MRVYLLESFVFPLFFGGLVSTGLAKPGDKIYQKGFLSIAEAQKSIEISDGYSLELVLSDPEVQEPVMAAWDGNGRLYVLEMRSYMQDAEATGEKEPKSRISRHVDTNGDGKYDQHTVFADGLVLPRFVLPLDDRIMLREADTLDLWTFRDTTGDGVADEKIKVYEGGAVKKNVVHQSSGLIWGLDNWLYLSYEAKRFRFTNGEVKVQDILSKTGQWGQSQDDWGRSYFADAAVEAPAVHFQQPFAYGHLGLPGQEEKGFRMIYPIAQVPDVQAGRRRVGRNGGASHFTGPAGLSIFRGENLPADLYGDLLIPEPVGRLIRRAKVKREYSKTVLSNATPKSEFIRARDINFRPVWTATTPGGQMLIVDMHRGVIQQGNWTKKGSYLRRIIDRWGLAKNIGKGRLYRLVHKDHKAGSQPKMLEETTAELVNHLSHPNGWWRDTAQKLIILREDRNSVISDLEKIVTTSSSDLGRLHALWTLEGMGKVKPRILVAALNDNASIVRTSAIRVAEPYMTLEDETVIEALKKPFPEDTEMAIQMLNSLAASRSEHPDLLAIEAKIANRFDHFEAVRTVANLRKVKREKAALSADYRKFKERLARAMANGKETYEQACYICHGKDGKGAPNFDRLGETLAPPLGGSPRITKSGESAIRIMLHGLTGPVDGESYDGLMLSSASNDDQWIADVVTYLRNSFGNEAPMVYPEAVAKLRKQHSDRGLPWTIEELEKFKPSELRYQSNWKLSANDNWQDLYLAFDLDLSSTYTTKARMNGRMWIQVEFPQKVQVSSVIMEMPEKPVGYPSIYYVLVSDDGESWSEPIAAGNGRSSLEIGFPAVETKFIRVYQLGKKNNFWTINDIKFMGKILSGAGR